MKSNRTKDNHHIANIGNIYSLHENIKLSNARVLEIYNWRRTLHFSSCNIWKSIWRTPNQDQFERFNSAAIKRTQLKLKNWEMKYNEFLLNIKNMKTRTFENDITVLIKLKIDLKRKRPKKNLSIWKKSFMLCYVLVTVYVSGCLVPGLARRFELRELERPGVFVLSSSAMRSLTTRANISWEMQRRM